MCNITIIYSLQKTGFKTFIKIYKFVRLGLGVREVLTETFVKVLVQNLKELRRFCTINESNIRMDLNNFLIKRRTLLRQIDNYTHKIFITLGLEGRLLSPWTCAIKLFKVVIVAVS
jgi:hypothetical protein